ncbi:MAG: aspartate carbamoyltransferase regulatory subunit, partial [Paludibacteraceae bacterium]|nr:aspartate carbamoyltransferase regulatory subunit [Paludibacteraceae bacterium]
KLFEVVALLDLEHCTNQITIGNNLDSRILGQKGIIKISDRFFAEEEINKIALIAPNAKINIVRNYEVVEKRCLELPDEVFGIIRCPNYNCVTNHQPITTHFVSLKEGGNASLKCHFCERDVALQDVELNN